MIAYFHALIVQINEQEVNISLNNLKKCLEGNCTLFWVMVLGVCNNVYCIVFIIVLKVKITLTAVAILGNMSVKLTRKYCHFVRAVKHNSSIDENKHAFYIPLVPATLSLNYFVKAHQLL